jgi:hypothetical protein
VKVYLIGSLRNPHVPDVAAELRTHGFDVFDDWYAAGPEADDYWQRYEQARGHNYAQALAGKAAQNVYAFDKRNLDDSDAAVLLLPAGKSGHLELGYMLGRGKPGYILLAGDPDRFDVMYNFATGVHYKVGELAEDLKKCACNPTPTSVARPPRRTHYELAGWPVPPKTDFSVQLEVPRRAQRLVVSASNPSNVDSAVSVGWELL